MKHIILAILTVLLLTACTPWYKTEAIKSAKHGTASGRINSSESNSENILQELD